MHHLILLTLASIQPTQLGDGPKLMPAPGRTLEVADPRTPIDFQHTPGDADSVYRIAEPGSYYLTANLNGQSGKTGIEVAASDVTIDLMGFTMFGTPASLNGITNDGAVNRVHVTNGSLVGFGGAGIDLRFADECRFERVSVCQNQSYGLWCGESSSVSNCIARENSHDGLRTGGSSEIIDSRAILNGSNGIRAEDTALVERCVSRGNVNSGIRVSTFSIVQSSITRTNGDHGIRVSSKGKVRDCLSMSNSSMGVFGQQHVRVENCEVSQNIEGGIEVRDHCRVTGNLAELNGKIGIGAGIIVKGSWGVIEDNHSVHNHYAGYIVEGTHNFLRRNLSGANVADWAIFANNSAYVLSASASGAILGASGGVAPGSDDPNANYTL